MAEQSTDRTAAVANALLQIEKQFGKGSIMKLGGREKIEVQSIPTGSISLDAALGVGVSHRHGSSGRPAVPAVGGSGRQAA